MFSFYSFSIVSLIKFALLVVASLVWHADTLYARKQLLLSAS